jgi:ATP-dependent DNA helicase RecQ
VSVRRGRIELTVDDFDPSTVSLERDERRRTYERSRVEMLRTYIELRDCRRRFLVNYFGEDYPRRECGYCDNDDERASMTARPGAAVAIGEPGFQVTERVRHASWGEGQVTRVQEDVITVLFDAVGYKTFDTALVVQRDILARLATDATLDYEEAS